MALGREHVQGMHEIHLEWIHSSFSSRISDGLSNHGKENGNYSTIQGSGFTSSLQIITQAGGMEAIPISSTAYAAFCRSPICPCTSRGPPRREQDLVRDAIYLPSISRASTTHVRTRIWRLFFHAFQDSCWRPNRSPTAIFPPSPSVQTRIRSSRP